MAAAHQIDLPLREQLDELVATMCRALNDPKRLLVLYALADEPHTVSELCELLDAPQSNTSQHLALLRDRGLVESVRHGSAVTYSLRHPRVIEAIDLLRAVLADEVARRNELVAGPPR